MLSPLIGGPGRELTSSWSATSPTPSSASMGERACAAAMAARGGRRKRALRRHMAANSSVGAGMAALCDWESLKGRRRRRVCRDLAQDYAPLLDVPLHWSDNELLMKGTPHHHLNCATLVPQLNDLLCLQLGRESDYGRHDSMA